MTDDLIKRLLAEETDLTDCAADCIEQLERENARLDAGWSDANFRALDAGLKLAKAVEALRIYAKISMIGGLAREVLAELEGK